MGKQWWKDPSDYFAPSQHGAEHTSCAGPIRVPRLQVCWLNRVLIDLQGLCSIMPLTQLGKQVLLLLSVCPIILNPLSIIIGFRSTHRPQLRLPFLSASDGYTVTTVNTHLIAHVTKTTHSSVVAQEVNPVSAWNSQAFLFNYLVKLSQFTKSVLYIYIDIGYMFIESKQYRESKKLRIQVFKNQGCCTIAIIASCFCLCVCFSFYIVIVGLIPRQAATHKLRRELKRRQITYSKTW